VNSEAVRAGTARRAFATAGLLGATWIRLPQEAAPCVPTWSCAHGGHVYDVAERYRERDDAGEVFASFGEEFSWRIASGMRAYPLIVPAAVPSAAARGIAEWCWRRESVVEEGWEPILASIHGQIDLWQRVEDERGPQTVLALLSMHGSRTESVGDWWGSGHYETLTRQAIHNAAEHDALPGSVSEMFADADRFADIAAHSPDALDDDLLRRLSRAIFDEQSRRRANGEPDTATVAFPDWAVEQLTELLGEDHDEPCASPAVPTRAPNPPDC
jgi:hypothetical protein